MKLTPDSNMTRLPGWGRGSASPAPLAPKWAGQFDTFDAWVATATARLTGATGSLGQDVPAICVDAKGRRCNIGRDFHRARDENAFPVRYFWECQPLPVGSAETDAFEWQLRRPTDEERLDCVPALRVSLAAETYDEIDRAYASMRANCGWPETPDREAFMAVEYAANHIEYKDEAGEFIADFVASDFADFLATRPSYATWRAERIGA